MSVLTCSAHLWEFDVVTGQGVNPEGVALTNYPVKTEDDSIWVAVPEKSESKSQNQGQGDNETTGEIIFNEDNQERTSKSSLANHIYASRCV